ncbi:DUF427 domain-containing protein [Jannaschia sp. LMIT008]|uniref:DUF427 domain-containing protein n=1 Tax=Jannaschia maritima TaxID=3032585 RepID=UPI002810B45F|nr:DUF427 domain-containing protein [Jannaschia sp. LMIT008]
MHAAGRLNTGHGTGGSTIAHIEITDAGGVWTVRTPDGVLVESRAAKMLHEGSYAPVVYFPPEDVAMALLERSDKTTTCPHKGVASYYDYVGPAQRIADIAWSYEAPDKDDAQPVAGHLAFDGGKATVEEL